MSLIPSAAHGVVDLAVAALLVGIPVMLGWDMGSAEALVPMILGVCIFIYSLFTHYRARDGKALSLEVHIVLDCLIAVLLIVSPWLFGFSDVVYLTHVVLGLSLFVIAMVSQGTPRGESIKDL